MLSALGVTTDFSEASRAAFEAGAALARKFKARLFLLHVAQRPSFFTPWQICAESSSEALERQVALEEKLRELAQREHVFQGLPVERRVLRGESADALAAFQKDEGLGLIVIATHGYSAQGRFPLGSFTAKVLQLVSCPVLVFRGFRDSRPAARAAFELRRILVPYDFSRPSGESLEVARSWARSFGASLKVLSVVEEGRSPDGAPGRTRPAGGERDLKAEALERLQEVVETRLKDYPAEALVRAGHPAVEILNEIEAFRPDLVIMASRGLSVLERLALGSVAERTIHGARCPVLVVRYSL